MAKFIQSLRNLFSSKKKSSTPSLLRETLKRVGLRKDPAAMKLQRRRYYRRRTINKASRVCKGFVEGHHGTHDRAYAAIHLDWLSAEEKPSKFWSRAALERVGLRKERHHLPGGRRETTIVSFAQWELNRKNERELLAA